MSKKKEEEREKIREEINRVWNIPLALTNDQLDILIELRKEGTVPIVDLRNFTNNESIKEDSSGQKR